MTHQPTGGGTAHTRHPRVGRCQNQAATAASVVYNPPKQTLRSYGSWELFPEESPFVSVFSFAAEIKNGGDVFSANQFHNQPLM